MFGHMNTHQRMTGLMIGSQSLLILAHHHGFSLCTHHHLILGALEIVIAHLIAVITCSIECCLIHQIGKVCTGKSRRTTRQCFYFNIGCQRHLLHMHFQNLLTTQQVGARNHHLAVKAARTQQRRVKYVGTVGGGHKNHTLVGLKAIHLNQQLVQCLFPFIVAAADTCATMTSHRIDFINEDNARCVLLALFKHITHTRCTDADKHLNKVRTGDGEERNIGFAGNRTGQQGFTCSRRAKQQHTFRNLATEPGKL